MALRLYFLIMTANVWWLCWLIVVARLLTIIVNWWSENELWSNKTTVSIEALPSSRKVNRPIWGKSLKVSRQMVPAVRRRAMQTWSCLTNRGRVLLLSPVFLSTRQIKACRRNKELENISTYTGIIQSIIQNIQLLHLLDHKPNQNGSDP